MRKRRTRLVAELILGAVVILLISLAVEWSWYREYCDKLILTATFIESQGEEGDIILTLKGKRALPQQKAEEILAEYGYENMRASRYGREFFGKSIGLACGGILLYTGYAGVLLYERKRAKKEQEEEWLKLARYLEEIRGGNYKPDYYDDYAEEIIYSDKVLDQLDSLCGYLDIVTEGARKEKEETKQLVTDISHQLKTPVAVLNSCFEILQKETLTVEEKQEFEMRLAHQLRGLGQLIETLVNISRLETGMIEIRLKKERIFDTILEAVNRVYPKAMEKQIEIELYGEEQMEGMLICHDRKWCCEAFINVLENAVKYSPHGTVVTIRAEKRISFLRIEIADQGIGIPRQEYHKIFQRFYRGEANEVQKEEGCGVGLYLTRKIISEHGGMISVDGHTKEGKGSVFVIQFPYTTSGSLTKL